MAFSGASVSSPSAEINVTPLIDVLLVLLIIFMVIVPVMPRGLESEVPQPSKTAVATAPGPVSLRVLSGEGQPDGQLIRYEVDGRLVKPERLGEALLASLRLRERRSVYVSASSGVSYGVIARAVSVAESAGATQVALGRL